MMQGGCVVQVRFLVAMLVAVSLTACLKQHEIHATELESEQVRSYKRMVVYGVDELPVGSFKILGREKGFSCDQDLLSGDVNKDEAMEQLRIRASLSQADALTNVVCGYRKNVDIQEHCFRAWVCAGDAIHITSPMLVPRLLERVSGEHE
jgi:hypothetical protein